MKLPLTVVRRAEGGHEATSGLLPGCLGMGRSPEEAVRGFLDAAKGYLAAAGDFVPERLDGLFELPRVAG